jgi:hypothetical protein
LLATQLHAVIAADIHAFGASLQLGSIVNDIASGNLAAPLAAVAPQDPAGFKSFMVEGYDAAFHRVVMILTGVCMVLSVLIISLLGPRARARVVGAADTLSASSK